MKYQPPFVPGATPAVPGIFNGDADAAYVNGDPLTGTPGSYFPGQALEHPQRELVKLLTAAGITPSHTVLEQVAEASARMASLGVFGVDSGTANAYVVSALPNVVAPKALFAGMAVTFIPQHTNITASNVNVFGTGLKLIVTYSGENVPPGALVAGRPTTMIYSSSLGGGAWFMVPWAQPRTIKGIEAKAVGGLSIPSSTQTTLSDCTNLTRNDFGGTPMSAGVFTVPANEAGWYLITAYWLPATFPASGWTSTYIYAGGRWFQTADTNSGSGSLIVPLCSALVPLAVGDTVYSRAFHSAASAVVTTTSGTLNIVKLSPF